MNYKPGQVIAKFTSKKGKEIELRIPKLGDEQGYLDFINSIIDEDDYILYNQPVSFEEEKIWLAKTVGDIIKGKALYLTAFYDDLIIGNASLGTCKGRKGHVAGFGITIKNGYREEGISTMMMETLFTEAKKMGIKLIDLGVYCTNKRAINAYKKMGFVEHGILPKAISHRGNYIDELLMHRHL
ncbi:MAG: GCN5-related N-acetyltransferase [uncultured bacterium]|nr:MAG: GCN5-related N-acetyltransferase [uncultured bacterium]